MHRSQHEDLEHSLRAGDLLGAAFDDALFEWLGLRWNLLLFALGGFLDRSVCCTFAAVDLK